MSTPNLADRHYAINLFSDYLKKNNKRFHGMSMKRIRRIVSAKISTFGWHSSPHYSVDMTDVTYKNGSLVRWNPRGGFNVTVM